MMGARVLMVMAKEQQQQQQQRKPNRSLADALEEGKWSHAALLSQDD
jgi:hypothetical protein